MIPDPKIPGWDSPPSEPIHYYDNDLSPDSTMDLSKVSFPRFYVYFMLIPLNFLEALGH